MDKIFCDICGQPMDRKPQDPQIDFSDSPWGFVIKYLGGSADVCLSCRSRLTVKLKSVLIEIKQMCEEADKRKEEFKG